MTIFRAWINQPSTFDLLHKMHGTRCIVQDDGGSTVRLWFTEGPIHSIEAPRKVISKLKLSEAG